MVFGNHVHQDGSMSFGSPQLPVGIGGYDVAFNCMLLQELGKHLTVCFSGAVKHHALRGTRPSQPCIEESFNETLSGSLLIWNGYMEICGSVHKVVETIHFSLRHVRWSLKSAGTLSLLGRATFGSCCSTQAGHTKSPLALTSSSDHPFLRNAICKTRMSKVLMDLSDSLLSMRW